MTTGAVISGIGQSAVGRRLGRSVMSLTLDAALEAIADAGLQTSDIDGVASWPGQASVTPGFAGVGPWEIQDALGLNLDWYSAGQDTAGQLGAVFNAVNAVATGAADHVLVFRSLWESTAQGAGARGGIGSGQRVDGWYGWLLPFGAVSAAIWCGWLAQRHFHEYGTTREQLGAIAVNQRANAALNPKAIYTDPLSLDDYLASRMISDPLCLYDCDVPIDGATAVIVSRADAKPDLRKVLHIEAMSGSLHGRPHWDQFDDLTSMAARDVGKTLWQRTELNPSDVDIAQLYDGFSILTLIWLEALQLCKKGEGGPFIEGGTRIARDGELPLNTGGGQLSAGRLHGYGHLYEACRQLRREAGDHQVPKAPEVAVVAAGGGLLGGALLLTVDR